MSCLVRLINYGIINFFIQQAEYSRYCSDQFLKYATYLLRYGAVPFLWIFLEKDLLWSRSR